ncbi:MAG TPA: N-acetylneuraminate synthase family protein [Bryobacteraceae bacterium]|nr:N-acetylneuraminate synthase family protein [Bryobacteraceae bacterium]
MNTNSEFLELIQQEPWPLSRHVFVIAEIGINHNGDVEIAKQLISLAKQAGCDAVKFQKRSIDIVYTKALLDSPRDSPWGSTQRAQKEGLEFGKAQYDEIDAYCKELDIPWFGSAWDVPSQLFLRQYDLPFNKIASAMIGHRDLVEAVASEEKMTFLSVGMASDAEIDSAVAIFRGRQCPFVMMHTVSEYPAPESALNLRCINTLRAKYACPVGYSGHESSMMPSVVAAAMGAVAIERHITLDRAMYGSDQAASLEKRGLELMVGYIRTIAEVAGDGIRSVTEKEKDVSRKLRYYATV